MRARGLSGEGDNACDAGNSGRVGSAPHAASNAHASNANAVPGQVRLGIGKPQPPGVPAAPFEEVARDEGTQEPIDPDLVLHYRSSRA